MPSLRSSSKRARLALLLSSQSALRRCVLATPLYFSTRPRRYAAMRLGRTRTQRPATRAECRQQARKREGLRVRVKGVQDHVRGTCEATQAVDCGLGRQCAAMLPCRDAAEGLALVEEHEDSLLEGSCRLHAATISLHAVACGSMPARPAWHACLPASCQTPNPSLPYP